LYQEKEYLKAIKEGDRKAYKYVFEHYYSRLCRYTSNLTYNADQAEDIVQEVFIHLWNNRKEILITTSLKSYLYKSCYNKCIDTYRKKKRVSEVLEEYRHAKLMELVEKDKNLDSNRMEILNRAIDHLPPRCKEIFLLSKSQGLKYKEIADHLGISQKTVENQIGRAYSILRREIGKLKLILLLVGACLLFVGK